MGSAELLDLVKRGGHVVISGAAGSGKTQHLLDLASELGTAQGQDAMGTVVLLASDRRRAARLESGLGVEAISKMRLPGGHRIARSVISYAYLIVAQWLVERREPQVRPSLITGAEEDLWVKEWLSDNRVLWDGILPDPALDSEWFRMDLRNVFARLGEYGLTADDLRELSVAADEPVWSPVADAYASYCGEDPFGPGSARLDSARIQRIAATILEQWDFRAQVEGVIGKPPVPKYILIDDVQDCTMATLAFLESLAAYGACIVATSCSDVAVSGFRGGRYDLGTYLATTLNSSVVTLDDQYRMKPQVDLVYQGIAAWLHGSPSPTPSGPPMPVSIVSSAGRRGAYLSDRIRRRYYLDGVEWKNQAVLVRSSQDIDEIRRFLRKANIPVARSNRAGRFAQIPVSTILLRLLRDANSSDGAESLALDLLTSPLVSIDELALFRLLRSSGLEAGPHSLVLILDDPELIPEAARTGQIWEQLRTASMLWRMKEKAAVENPQRGIWTLWHAADKAESWRETALRGGREGERADDNLDTILALLRRADLWQQENPLEATARDFALALLEEGIVTDSIADVGLRSPGVEVLTVAEASGREWDSIYVCGLQDGAWPILTQPGSLLATTRLLGLLDLLAGTEWRSSRGKNLVGFFDPSVLRADADINAAARERRHSEARLLASAVSRTKGSLEIVIISDQDQAPSRFVNNLVRNGMLEPFTNEQGTITISDPQRPFDLAGVIGQLRHATIDPATDDEQRRNAALALAALAVKGVAGADPTYWMGSGSITSDDPVISGKSNLSPSAIQNARECMLSWFFRSVNAENQPSPFEPVELSPLDIGNMIHTLAERLPFGTPSELRAEFEALWNELDLDDGTYWVRRQKQEMEDMVSRLAEHFQHRPADVKTEVPFTVEVENAVIRGRIDRIEIDDSGNATIVDIKTGKSRFTKAQVENNAQLSAYQLALRKTLNVAGAGLLTVGVPETSRTPLLREQAPLDDQKAADVEDELNELGLSAKGPDYKPTVSSRCRTCTFVNVCPAQENSLRGIE